MSMICEQRGHCTQRKSASGFTLLEVLVVMVVLSFGLLGIAGVQANTAKYKINSWARSSASIQMSSLAESVRANPRQAGAGAAASLYVVDDDWATQQLDTLTVGTDCLTGTCTGAERAAYDLVVWRRQVRSLFPQGAVAVSGNAAGGINTTIAWFDKQFVDASGALDRPLVCAAGQNMTQQATCCPSDLVGDPAEPGVRCANLSFVP
jgi:type IV pilus assembly protein PilV